MLCCYDLRYECTAECAAACVIPDSTEPNATKIVCSRLVRETSTAFSSAKSDDPVETMPATPTVPATNILLYR